jgi:hypothetical protein
MPGSAHPELSSGAMRGTWASRVAGESGFVVASLLGMTIMTGRPRNDDKDGLSFSGSCRMNVKLNQARDGCCS